MSLALHNVSQADPLTQETLAALLPQSVAADLGTGEHIDLELTWDLSALPESGAWAGTYTVTGALPQLYALTEEAADLVVVLELDGTESYANRKAIPSGTPPYEELWVNGLSPQGTTVNLFDYWLTTQTDADNYALSWLINKGINAEHALLFGIGIQSQNRNVGNWNYWTGSKAPKTGIVDSELEDGYPKLNVDMSQASDANFKNRNDSESLAYLFDPNIQHTGKASYEDVQRLLQVDEDGYYYYNSHKNYAVYYEDANSFTLYQRPGVRTGGSSPNGQFFPFNTATTNTGTFMNNNPSTHSSINHYFGMHMTTRFIQQNSGHIDESRTKPVTYEFSGDDDVWIFIDGVLVADLGGIHDMASVKLDFSTGIITINNQTQSQRLGTILGYTTDILPDNTYHTLDFFYLERGNVDSNMNLRYNLLTVPKSNLIKVDQMGDAVAGAVFELYAVDEYRKNGTAATPIATGTTLILVESNVPPGYRSNGDIELYFHTTKADEVLLLSNSIWDKGAYAMAKVTSTAPTKIKLKTDANSVPPQGNEIVDLSKIKNPLMFAVVYQKQEHQDANGADIWLPVSGDPLQGWTVEQDSSWKSILHAAQKNPYVFQMASDGTYQVEVSDLPGAIESYYHICDNIDDARYTVGYYYTTASTLSQATETNTWRIDSDPPEEDKQYALDRVFAMNLYVTNINNRMLVHKTDMAGNALEGAIFSLYRQEDVTITADGYTIQEDAVPYDEITTKNLSTANGDLVTLRGGGVFPSETKGILEEGRYYLIETAPPNEDYQENPTAIPVVVDKTGVYADAGTITDGVAVTRGVGSVVHSMVQFAAADQVDATLYDIKAQLLTSQDNPGTDTGWSTWDDTVTDTNIPEKELHLQYESDSSKRILDYGPANRWPSQKVGLMTDVGWSKLEIRQCQNPKDSDLDSHKEDLGSRNLVNLFSGSVTVHVKNLYTQPAGDLRVSKIVTGENPDTTTAFHFRVTLTGESTDPDTQQPISGSDIAGTYGGMTFQNGVADFTLTHGQTVTASRLPAGLTYTVTEEASEEYTAIWTGQNGTIQTNAVAQVHCINEKNEDSVPAGNLSITKTVTGEGDREKAWTFSVTLKDGTGADLSGSFAYSGSKTGTLTSGGTIQLKHGETVIISGIPAGTQYLVTEAEANQDSYQTTASGTQGNIMEDADAQAMFINEKKDGGDGGVSDPTGNLSINKTVTGEGDREKYWTFSVTLKDSTGADLSGSFAYSGSKTGALTSGGTIQLKHGETVIISGIPAGTQYLVTEAEANQDGYQTTTGGTQGNIMEDADAQAMFINEKKTGAMEKSRIPPET